jgi:lipid A 4'-phosphatase
MTQSATSQTELETPHGCAASRPGILGDFGKRVLNAFRSPAVWAPLLLVASATLIFRFTDADLVLVRPFFAGAKIGDHTANAWPLRSVHPWKALFYYGIYPAWILGCTGGILCLISFVWPRFRPWRRVGLFYFLLLVIGPGLIVNSILKPHWGRPRPNSIVAFGGDRQFVSVGQWGYGQDDTSFPSGHASVGFYLMAPAFACYPRRPRWALAFLLFGLLSGCLIGLARIVAGGHFPSDVLWSGAIVYFTGLVLARLLGMNTETEIAPPGLSAARSVEN